MALKPVHRTGSQTIVLSPAPSTGALKKIKACCGDTRLSLGGLSADLGVSARYLGRVFHQQTGVRDGIDYNFTPVSQCPTDGNYYYNVKLRVVFPDGSKHLLRLRLGGESDLGGDGYYRYNPYGQGSGTCAAGLAYIPASTPMVYYTTDGTFVRAVVQHNDSSQI